MKLYLPACLQVIEKIKCGGPAEKRACAGMCVRQHFSALIFCILFHLRKKDEEERNEMRLAIKMLINLDQTSQNTLILIHLSAPDQKAFQINVPMACLPQAGANTYILRAGLLWAEFCINGNSIFELLTTIFKPTSLESIHHIDHSSDIY